MNVKRLFIGVPVVAGLALLLLAVAGAKASSPQSQPVLPNAPESTIHTLAVTPTFWTSGWTDINQGQTLTFNHNLGLPPEQLAVELWFKDTGIGGMGINLANYGGLEANGNWHGAFWRNLTANSIQVRRLANDNHADQVRIQVWAVSPPDYDSGWTSIDPSTSPHFFHGLTVTPTDLSVSVWFSGTLHGINQFSYGGLTDGDLERGAYWWMTDDAVRVFRRADDANIEQVRVVVVHGAAPDYDSLVTLGGWQTMTQGVPFTFTHNLNWDPDKLMVRAECRDDAVSEKVYHQIWAGGDEYNDGLFRGAYLQNLTANTVQFVRRANDNECDFARVVISRRSAKIYLPVLMY